MYKACNLAKNEFIKCYLCGVLCVSANCLKLHRLNFCCKIPKCKVCGSFKIKNHVCNGKWCLFCKSSVEIDHRCYILTENENLIINKNAVKKQMDMYFLIMKQCKLRVDIR